MAYYGRNKRYCEGCHADISDLPSNYTLCSECYRDRNSGSRGGFSSSSGGATDKQVRLLMTLKDEGYVDEDIYFKGLSVSQASSLIEEALAKKNR